MTHARSNARDRRSPVLILTVVSLALASPSGTAAQAPTTPVCEDAPTGVFAHPTLPLQARVDWFERVGIDLTDPSFVLLEEGVTEIGNVREFINAMERRYPELMKEHGLVQGRVFVALRLEPDGARTDQLVIHSSGEEVLDEMALQLAEVIEWTPPTTPEGCRIPVWVTQPMTFEVRGRQMLQRRPSTKP